MEGIWLRMSTAEPGTCRIKATPAAIATGRVAPATPVSPALAEQDSMAYLAIRRAPEGTSRWEVGAIGHGPHGANLGKRIAAQIRCWAIDHDATPDITLHPATTPLEALPTGLAITKHDSIMLLTWH
ncbi:hypothetical protein [Actinomadura gamaensis]|uniref:Uncharacterized protein n=1 Tax=Actinomadura gamaensis TaxID=1763541 RepID=A0ABV9U8Y1_9ACTN